MEQAVKRPIWVLFGVMARKREARRETSTGGSESNDSTDSYVWWTTKAGRKTGFDFRTNSAIFGDGSSIPIEFLEAEARRDKAVLGRIVPMDCLDFATVQAGFEKRLQDYEEQKITELRSPTSSPRAHFGANSGWRQKMDGHADRQSPSIKAASDVKRYAQQYEALAGRSPRLSCSLLPLRKPADDTMDSGENDRTPVLPAATPMDTEFEHASTSCTRQRPQRSQDSVAEARSGEQEASRTQWTPGKIALYEQRSGNGGQRFVTVQVTTTQRVSEGGMFSSSDGRGNIFVTDGAKEFFAPEGALMEMEVSSGLVARLQSGAGTSPSPTALPTSQTSVSNVWEWLTPVGLAQAESIAVPVPKGAVPHLVGKGGATIRRIEELIGIIIGVMDGQDGQATVSLVGPQQRVAAARSLIQAAAGGGAWSLLRRIQDRGTLFV